MFFKDFHSLQKLNLLFWIRYTSYASLYTYTYLQRREQTIWLFSLLCISFLCRLRHYIKGNSEWQGQEEQKTNNMQRSEKKEKIEHKRKLRI